MGWVTRRGAFPVRVDPPRRCPGRVGPAACKGRSDIRPSSAYASGRAWRLPARDHPPREGPCPAGRRTTHARTAVQSGAGMGGRPGAGAGGTSTAGTPRGPGRTGAAQRRRALEFAQYRTPGRSRPARARARARVRARARGACCRASALTCVPGRGERVTRRAGACRHYVTIVLGVQHSRMLQGATPRSWKVMGLEVGSARRPHCR